MSEHFSSEKFELYRQLDRVLFEDWDPIGISSTHCPKDEYRDYLPKFFSMVLEDESPEYIAHYLGIVATETIGMEPNPQHDLEIAKKALVIKRSCFGR